MGCASAQASARVEQAHGLIISAPDQPVTVMPQ
jgi:hypothetical protein